MDWFPLDIFPGGGFDTSIMTVVFLGLLIAWWLTETFGFVFVGLVVPGYLASVFVISPTSAIVVLVESVATYALVWFCSEFFGRTRVWSIFFGRDRFFAFLLISLFVRLVGELWLWPDIWRIWTSALGVSPHLPGALNSVGLVLVPLAANMFWKLGLARGFLQVGVPTVLVYFFATVLLLPLTNLRFSEFQVQYEDVAVDILNSPKSYIIMLVTAVLAARANIRFGWDFGGILIPALIAISWFDINKGLVTLAEAVLLVWISKYLMEKYFSQSNLEGPRRVVFVFTTGFLLKFIIAWILFLAAPSLRVIDFFGFGYLLSSLLAVTMLRKKSIGLVMVPTVIVSVVGFIFGGIIAAALSAGDEEPVLNDDDTVAMQAETPLAIESSLLSRHSLVENRPALGHPITPLELERFETVMATIDSNARRGRVAQRTLASSLDELGVEVEVLADGEEQVMVIGEPIETFPRQRGWGVYVYWPTRTGPVVQVPTVPSEPLSMLASLSVARATNARAMFFGSLASTPTGRVLNPNTEGISPFHRAQIESRRGDIVQLRFGRKTKLWLGDGIKDLFPVGALTDFATEVTFGWPPEASIQRAQAQANFVTLDLDHEAVAGVVADASLDHPSVSDIGWQDVESHIVGADRRIASSVSEIGAALPASQVEAAQRAVLQPLFAIAQQPPPEWRMEQSLRNISFAASLLGLAVERVDSAQDCYYVVSEVTQPVRGFGISMIRCDAGAPVILQAPFALTEKSTWRFGLLFARDIDARNFSVGSVIGTASDQLAGSPLKYGSLVAASQRAAISLPGSGQIWTIQLRGLSAERGVQHDALISIESPIPMGKPPADIGYVISTLTDGGISASADAGSIELSGLRGIPDISMNYARRQQKGRYARIWLSQALRDRLTPSPGVDTLRRAASRIEAEVRVADIEAARREPPVSVNAAPDIEVFVQLAERFAITRNVLHLRKLTTSMRAVGLTPVVWVDETRGQSWVTASYAVGEGTPRLLAIRIQRTDNGEVLDDLKNLTELELINAKAIDAEVQQ